MCSATARSSSGSTAVAPRALLVIADGETLRFWTPTADLEAVLRGDPLQISAGGGFCRIEAEGGTVRVEYGVPSARPKRCAVPADEFARLLDRLRQDGKDHAPAPSPLSAPPPFRPDGVADAF